MIVRVIHDEAFAQHPVERITGLKPHLVGIVHDPRTVRVQAVGDIDIQETGVVRGAGQKDAAQQPNQQDDPSAVHREPPRENRNGFSVAFLNSVTLVRKPSQSSTG